jgi:hypothetical protein
VVEGYISRNAAREEYGVVLTEDGDSVDPAATAELRNARGAESRDRGPRPSD